MIGERNSVTVKSVTDELEDLELTYRTRRKALRALLKVLQAELPATEVEIAEDTSHD